MRKYDDEVKRNAVRKVLDGQSVRSVSQHLGVNESQIHKWKRAALKNGDGSRSGAELAEIGALKKRNRELEMENEILKNVWLRRRSQPSKELFWHQAGRMQQMYPASFVKALAFEP